MLDPLASGADEPLTEAGAAGYAGPHTTNAVDPGDVAHVPLWIACCTQRAYAGTLG